VRGIEALKAALKHADVRAGQIRPAKPEDLAKAENAGFPRELLDFYKEYEPGVAGIEIYQRMWSIKTALIENTKAVPGTGLYPHGYIVFASTTCGDAYCIDTNIANEQGEHPVVLFAHDEINKNTELSYIQRSRVEVASSLDDFLYRFATGILSEEVVYPK
jgi:hypothetical protein